MIMSIATSLIELTVTHFYNAKVVWGEVLWYAQLCVCVYVLCVCVLCPMHVYTFMCVLCAYALYICMLVCVFVCVCLYVCVCICVVEIRPQVRNKDNSSNFLFGKWLR